MPLCLCSVRDHHWHQIVVREKVTHHKAETISSISKVAVVINIMTILLAYTKSLWIWEIKTVAISDYLVTCLENKRQH